MLRKENRNPNKSSNVSKGLINKSMATQSVTPDNSTTRNYKPKFIKKNINIQDELLYCQNHVETINHSQTYINSPVSITENNTVDIQTMIQNKGKWRENCLRAQKELQDRTAKFNESISYFHQILFDLKKVVDNQGVSPQQRLNYTSNRLAGLLNAFQDFNMTSNQ